MNVKSRQKAVVEPTENIVATEKVPPISLISDLNELEKKSPAELIEIAESFNIGGLARVQKEDMIFALLKECAKRGGEITGSGVLHIRNKESGSNNNNSGYFGFLRSAESSYKKGPNDIYISSRQIDTFKLRTGDTISGKIRPPKESERYFALLQIKEINQMDPVAAKNKILFKNLTPLYAHDRLVLERGDGAPEDLTGRIIDLATPLGKGQRGLILAPPRAGKTMILKHIAQSITHNHPECYLIVLLIDERPEEVTDMKRSVQGEVIASTFDEKPSRHIQVAEMMLEKAKRLVEQKRDVVILLDSITRLARAYNAEMPSSGKVLTGGIDANALQPPKRFLGAARNIEEGGSLTILATALTDTESKAENVLHKEFDGTGNVILRLSLELAESRIFPAINYKLSGVRREDLLIPEEELQRRHILRKILSTMETVAGMEFLIDRVKSTKTNADFFDAMKK